MTTFDKTNTPILQLRIVSSVQHMNKFHKNVRHAKSVSAIAARSTCTDETHLFVFLQAKLYSQTAGKIKNI